MVSFQDSPEQAAFRAEVRGFLEEALPATFAGREDEVSWFRRLKDRGWYAPAWPAEHGGGGLSVTEQFILSEEFAWRRAPRPHRAATGLAGPTVIAHGTDEQKRRFLPQMLEPGVQWCQLFSEPNAGSDLAALQTTAVRDGDDYVVNGHKIWTTGGHLSQWGILLARTDRDAPKHRGISYFLVDMQSPGVEVRPLINMANRHDFNEVFLSDVRIPAENMVGPENRGWYVGTSTLNFERSAIANSVDIVRRTNDLIEFARRTGTGKAGPVRQALVERHIESALAPLLSYRIISMQMRGENPAYESSVAKLFHSELTQRVAVTGMKVAGMAGMLLSGGHRQGPFGLRYLLTVPTTIGGGASEIVRNVIATRGLGLPR